MSVNIKQFCEMLFDAGIDQVIINNILDNSSKIYLDYDISNELDLQILRNKTNAISEKTISSENIHDSELTAWVIKILRTKY